MKKMKKLNKAIAIALSAVTVLSASSVVPITASAKVTNVVTSSATSKNSGKWDKNAKWSYNSKTKTLTITGKGTLEANSEEIPSKIEHIVVKNGITALAEFSLNYIRSAKDITLPSSIRKIDDYAFVFDYFDYEASEYVKFSHNVKIYAEYGSVTQEFCSASKAYYKTTYGNKFRGDFYPINKSKNRTSGACGANNVNWKLDKNGKMTITGKGAMYGKPAAQTFDKRKVKEVVVGNGVTDIFQGCFRDYPNLKKVTLPNSVTKIGKMAFYDCKKLQTVVMPKNVKEISASAFRNCVKLKNVQLPNTITYLGTCIFKNCKSITTANVQGKYTAIPNEMFSGCTNLTKVTLSNNIRKIRPGAFAFCSKLKTINLSKNIVEVSCDSYKQGVFLDCSSLESINVSADNEKYTSVDGVLYTKNMKKLIQYPAAKKSTTYEVPITLSNITAYAFRQCKNLKVITILNNEKKFNYNPFMKCLNLEKFVVDKDNKYYSSVRGMLYNKEGDTLLIFPAKKATTYTLPTGTKCINYSAFANSVLKKLKIPNTVEEIYNDAFYNSKNLYSVNIPSTVTFVGEDAFKNTKYYNTSKNWYKGQLYISNCVVATKKNIKSVSLKSDTRLIAECAYTGNKYIKTLTVPNSVKYINGYAFYNCYKLKKVTLNKSLKKIGDLNFESDAIEEKNCVLYVYKNSEGYRYAKSTYIKYKLIK